MPGTERAPPRRAAEPAPGRAADLALLADAAREAGAIAMGHFRRSPAWRDKPDGQGPVSEADLAVDAALRARLMAARPDHGWLSEEAPDDPARLRHARVFVVDPIDGTRAFLKGETGWGLSLALVEDGRPVAAVMHMPALGATYAAAEGMGARRDGAPIRPSGRTGVEGAGMLCSRAALAADRWPAGPPPVERHHRPALAHRLCLVAEGRFDAVLSLAPVWEWDVAAGALIATEAGAVATDAAGRPLRFNTPERRAPGIVAATPGVHGGLMGGVAA